jgi:hypothetical protein
MPVKSFKFVSPGVFINEIDNSFRPRQPEAIGPVIVGRATRGLSMQPVKLASFSDFLTMYGGTVPGAAGGDVYRDGNYQSPMYGTYAARAFLNASVAPVTYVRLLGSQHTSATAAGKAGWQTTESPADVGGSIDSNGGAFGLWVFPSSSNDTCGTGAGASDNLGTAVLSAVWYVDEDCSVQLTGTLANATTGLVKAEGLGMVIESDANGLFTAVVKGSKASTGANETFVFNFDDTDQRFIRKVFNTNPQLVNGGDFYDATLERNYWLGETFEQELLEGQPGIGSITGSDDTSTASQKMFGVILPIIKGTVGPNSMRLATQEAQTGWVIGQDIGAASDWVPEQAYKLFKLKGRGHGEWLHKNTKISIEKIRYSNTQTSDFGSFSIVIRSLTDTDSNSVVLERFDNLSLDPRSTNYISRRIGDRYYEWNETERRLREYGEYLNQSKFVYVSEINEGNIQNANSLIPFGYYGPPNFSGVTNWSGSITDLAVASSYIRVSAIPFGGSALGGAAAGLLSGSTGNFTGSLVWPSVRLRHSASDGGLSNQTDAYFGMQTTRTVGSTRADLSVKDYHRLWLSDGWGGSGAGLVAQSYIFTMNDIVTSSAIPGAAYYSSGSRKAGTSYSSLTGKTYKDLLDLGYDKFTMPVWGGFDGFDITKPDPVANVNMGTGVTDKTSYVFNTYKRAIDTVADPEFVDMNLLTVPGLTRDGLTTHMVNVCQDRADALALIDLPDVYLPTHEGDYSNKSTLQSRQVKDPSQAANDLRQRQIDSSYGATFYPWVQTVDEGTGQSLWVPPTVAMMGVLASSERSSQIWFAPAGFNRGGLSDGAAGIPVTSVSRRLTSKERDTLYEARINPIASFPSTGIVVFGQKTLQEKPSALDRINVRRLVIFLKKQISILSTQILFEQNVQATWSRFKGLIEPFLANVKTQFGITDYRLILDESTTTPDLVDQNVVYAKIMIKPARAIEYIAIDFIVASTGASFDD